jgi:hypothetical protein
MMVAPFIRKKSQAAARMSTMKTIVSVPLMPASGLPALP